VKHGELENAAGHPPILLVAARYYLKFRAIALTLRARLHSQPLMLVATASRSDPRRAARFPAPTTFVFSGSGLLSTFASTDKMLLTPLFVTLVAKNILKNDLAPYCVNHRENEKR